MRELKQSTAANVMVFMVDSTDHVTAKTGLTLTITASKDGAAFASITPTVTERGTGWYNLALTSSHTDTLGDLALHVTATGADASDLVTRIIAMDKTVANTPANVIQAAGTAWGSGAITSGAFASGAITASAVATDAVTEIQSGLATAANLSTLTGYVDTEVAAIKAKTDNLPAAPAATGDIPTSATIADAVLDEVVEGSYTLRQLLRLAASALAGKVSGAATTTVTFRDLADSKDRITATVDADGNRTALTLDVS